MDSEKSGSEDGIGGCLQKKRGELPNGKKTVLIIDDDRDFCQSLQSLLETDGYEVVCAGTGTQGLKLALSGKPDLIILDVMMEHMWAGYEVTQTLKFHSSCQSLHSVPIVMVSSVEQPPAQRFLRSVDSHMISPNVYLSKPLEVRSFIETMHALCPLA